MLFVLQQQGHHATNKGMVLFAKEIGVLPNLYFWNSKALQHDGSQDAPALKCPLIGDRTRRQVPGRLNRGGKSKESPPPTPRQGFSV